jgi:hypothetical protein
MVVAHGGTGGPHLLFYGHYDVQPVDPLDLWDRDPFDPEIEERPRARSSAPAALVGRQGPADDLSRGLPRLEGRAWQPALQADDLSGRRRGIGSPSLIPFMKENAGELRADLALICDTGLFEDAVPAITTMLRGLLGGIHDPRRVARPAFGHVWRAAINPIHVLTRSSRACMTIRAASGAGLL